MADVVVLYKTPKDTAAFDKYYAETHIPLARKMPGLRKYQVSQGPVATPAGPSGLHLIATLTFDSMAAVQNAFGSGSMGGFGNPNPQGGGSSGRRYFAPAALDCPLVQAEMVLSYDVQ